ncbi:MAG: AMP-binding protein, partial [Bacillota bacterium]
MAEPQPVAIEGDDTIATVFARRVAASPDAVAYHDFDAAHGEWRALTWREVEAQVARVRAAFAREGLERGERVAIMLRNSREWVFFDQAAHAEGLVVVPLYVDDRPDNIAYILDDAACRIVLVEGEEHLKKLAGIADRIPTVKRIVCVKECASSDARVAAFGEWAREEAKPAPPAPTAGTALATIVYTSGTTGRPKGVMLSHQNMLQNVKSALAAFAVYRDDRFLSFLPLSHMFERTAGYYLAITAGATVAFARSIPQLADDFRAMKPTVIIAVPRIFERLHAQVQATLVEAPPLRRRLFDATHRLGWQVFEWQQKRGPWRASFIAWPVLRALVAKKLLDRLGGRLRLC